MAMKRCPVCGEKYSDTYRYCPFCEEEELEREGRQVRRRGGRRGGPRQEPNLISPILIGIIIILSLLLLYLFFGDAIGEKLKPNASSSSQQSSQQVPSGSQSASSAPEPDISMPDSSEASGGETEPGGSVDVASLPETLTLSNPDFTLRIKGETTKLSVNGGSGEYTWVSEDESVATVSDGGVVTAVGDGMTTITAYNGAAKGTAIARVRGVGTASAPVASAEPTPSGGENKLNKTDFTLPVGDPDVKLTVSGITTAITWTSKNPAVATVSSEGVVKAVGHGTTTVTASWDGQSLECIVRVP